MTARLPWCIDSLNGIAVGTHYYRVLVIVDGQRLATFKGHTVFALAESPQAVFAKPLVCADETAEDACDLARDYYMRERHPTAKVIDIIVRQAPPDFIDRDGRGHPVKNGTVRDWPALIEFVRSTNGIEEAFEFAFSDES
jgi:hypothetical protein